MAGLARLAVAGEVPAPQLPPGSLGLLRQLPLGVKPSWPPSSSSLRCPRSAIETILRSTCWRGWAVEADEQPRLRCRPGRWRPVGADSVICDMTSRSQTGNVRKRRRIRVAGR